MLGKSHNIVGEEEVCGGGYDYLKAVGGSNADTAGVADATPCVHNYCPYGRFDIESSGGMANESTRAPSPSFYPSLMLATLASLAASRSSIVGSKSSGVVGRG